MKNVARPKRPRERVATPLELQDEAERCRRARETHRPLAPTPAPSEGNLVKCLVVFAAWRPCCICGSLTLFVNSQARTEGDVECPSCVRVRENLAKRLQRPPLHERVRFHLASLFTVSNDNGVASTVGG